MNKTKENLLIIIEETRHHLNSICFQQKEKLLIESRNLDNLIIKYHKAKSFPTAAHKTETKTHTT